MKFEKILTIIFVTFCFFMTVSCICATDNFNQTVGSASTDIIIDNAVNINVVGTFDELNTDIQNLHSGDVYQLNKDYAFNKKTAKSCNDHVISINNDNITINGNNHIIDAGGLSQHFSIFKINGNNVKICNLTFTNAQPKGNLVIKDNFYYEFVNSPISWNGDGGVLSNCNFYKNTAINGGALSWNGNNGIINNCQFSYNIAHGVGGAIYMNGENNTIDNVITLNSYSELTGDSIYFDRNRKNISINNLTSDYNSNVLIDGKQVDFDVNYLYYGALVNVGAKIINDGFAVDMIPIMYKTILYGSTEDSHHKYYSEYDQKSGQYILNVYSNYADAFKGKDGLEIIDHFYFNISNYNDLFEDILNHNYNVSTTRVANVFVNNEEDYVGIFNKQKTIPTLPTFYQTTKTLNVVLANKLTIASTYCWNLEELGYDVIHIEGNNSKIQVSTKPRESFKWVITNDENYHFSASNIEVEGFNQAIVNKGTCILINVSLNGNKMNYLIDKDWGSAILNTGYCICNNCTFTNNYCKNGGSIFNQGLLELDSNTLFKENTAYGVGSDVCVGDGGSVIIDGKTISENIDNIYFAESMSHSKTVWSSIATVAGGFLSGVVVGIVTCNPIAGVAAGVAIGATIGAVGAASIISKHYDVNFNRFKISLCLIGASAVAGGLGGLAGYYASTVTIPAAPIQPAPANPAVAGVMGENSVITITKGGHVQHAAHLAGEAVVNEPSCLLTFFKCLVL